MTRPLAALLATVSVLALSCAPPGPELVDRAPELPAADAATIQAGKPVPVRDGLEVLRSVLTTTTTTVAAPSVTTTTRPRPVEAPKEPPSHLRVHRSQQVAPVLDFTTAASGPAEPGPVAAAPPTTVAPAPAPPATTIPPQPSPPATSVPPPPPPPPTTDPPPTTAPPTTTLPAQTGVGEAAEFVASVNGVRGSAGLGVLSRNSDLDSRAQAWTEYMASSGDFSHSTIINDLVASGWSIAGENLGYGPTVSSVMSALVDSPGHHANMVNPSFTTIGVGVVISDGVVWTTHLFAG